MTLTAKQKRKQKRKLRGAPPPGYDAPTFMVGGREHTFVPASPSMRALQVLQQADMNFVGSSTASADLPALVAFIDGERPHKADPSVQWGAFIAALDFFGEVFDMTAAAGADNSGMPSE